MKTWGLGYNKKCKNGQNMTEREKVAYMEWLTIYDESLKVIGRKPRTLVHQDGDLHYVIHCWVFSPDGQEIILQKRSKDKDFGPNQYDVSCAGHYSADDSFTSTRELYEELGISVDYDKLDYLFDFQEIFNYRGAIDREIARVHFLRADFKGIQPVFVEEIEALRKCKVSDLLDLFQLKIDRLPIYTLEGRQAIEEIGISDFVKRSEPYYRALIPYIERVFHHE